VLAGVNIQPSEFVKPAFVILISWLFAESTRKADMPANTMALGCSARSCAVWCCSRTSARRC
jgi:cell division protein FtsW (lipid II flippase)